MKRVLSYILIFTVMMVNIIFCDDNADSGGNGNVNNATHGFYKKSEYMYKVSVYIGKKENADITDNLNNDFYLLGNTSIYLKDKSFKLDTSKDIFLGKYNKCQYLNGFKFETEIEQNTYDADVPAPPLSHDGSLSIVKKYFGDTNTLTFLIDKISESKGISSSELVESYKYLYNSEWKNISAEFLLPIKENGKYKNLYPFVVVYEPVSLIHLKDNKRILAFTATECALAQKLGIVDFGYSANGQAVKKLTHRAMPNSIFLEKSWFGYGEGLNLGDKFWSENQIINVGGWGMRILRPKKIIVNDIEYDFSYRTNTEVITSIKVNALNDIYPDDRHLHTLMSSEGYLNPNDTSAYVTFNVNGFTNTQKVIMPSGASQFSFIKWTTPNEEGKVLVEAKITNNPNLVFENNLQEISFFVDVVDLVELVPPDPRPHDEMPSDFKIKNPPHKSSKKELEWNIYNADFEDNIKFNEFNQLVNNGKWVYTYTNYKAKLSSKLKFVQHTHCVTTKWENRKMILKSGYGYNVSVKSKVITNSPEEAYTKPQKVLVRFPEFSYKDYFRLLEYYDNTYQFKVNKYSILGDRVHFTPLRYPDGKYEITAEVFDCYTPAGMLRRYLTEDMTIEGNMYQDWHVQKGITEREIEIDLNLFGDDD